MTYEDNNAVYALNSYLWKLLEANLGWTKATYQGATPIIPLAQQPEFMALGKPFIIYGSSVHPTKHLYAVRKESVSYVIYSQSTTEINRIINLLVETFERQDEAAADVNEWLDADGAVNEPWGVSFKSISTTLSDPPREAEQEGGWNGGNVMLELQFSILSPSPVTNGFIPTP